MGSLTQGSKRLRAHLVLFLLAPLLLAQSADPEWKKAYLLSRAGHFYAEKEYDQAKKLFEAILAIDDGDETALMHLAAIAKHNNDQARQLDYLQRAANVHPSSLAAQYEYGALLLAMGQAEQAIPPLRNAVELKPEFLDARINLGNAYLEARKYGEATRTLKEAVTRAPQSAWAHRQYGVALFSSGQYGPAITQLKIALRDTPDDVGLLLTMGHAELKLGNASQALSLYERVIELDPKLSDGYVFAGILHNNENRKEIAEQYFNRAIKTAPKSPLPRVHLGNLYLEQERVKDAKEQFQKALELDPNTVWALTQLGFVAMEEGNAQEATQLLQKALRLSPGSPDVELALGDLYAIRGKLRKARAYYRNVLKRSPTHLAGTLKLADILMRQNQLDKAYKLFEKANQQHPSSAWAYIVRGDCEVKLLRYEDAKTSYLTALKLDPRSSWAKRQLGYLMFELGEHKEAKKMLEAAREDFSEEIDVYLTLGHIGRKLGDYGYARDAYAAVLTIDPKSARGLLFMGILDYDAGNFEDAVVQLRRSTTYGEGYVDAWVLLGDVLGQLSKQVAAKAPARSRDLVGEAMGAYRTAISLKEDALWPKRQLGFLLYEAGQVKDAEKLLLEAWVDFLFDVEIPLTLGHIRYNEDKKDEALEYYMRAVDVAKDGDPRPFVFAGTLLREKEELLRSLELLAQGAEKSPKSPKIWYELAVTQVELRRFDAAYQSMETAIAGETEDREIWLFAGKMRQMFEEYQAAQEAYLKALEISPDYAASHLALASVYLDINDIQLFGEAVAHIDLALKELSDDPFARLVAGQLYARVYHHEKKGVRFDNGMADHPLSQYIAKDSRAMRHLRRALALRPHHHQQRLSVARSMLLVDRDEEAHETLGPLLKMDPSLCPKSSWALTQYFIEHGTGLPNPPADSPQLRETMERMEVLSLAQVLAGDLAMEKAQLARARHHYGCALGIRPRHAEAHLKLGLLYENDALYRPAEEHYMMALALKPNLEVASVGLDRVRKEGGFPVPLPFKGARTTSRLRYMSELLPAELAVRNSRVVRLAGDERSRIYTVPRRLNLGAGLSYRNPEWTAMPRLQASYDFYDSKNEFLNDNLRFAKSKRHHLRIGGTGRAWLRKERLLETTYHFDQEFLFGDTASRSDFSLVSTLGAQFTRQKLGSARGLLSFNRTSFEAKQAGGTQDRANTGTLQLGVTPWLQNLRLQSHTTYQASFTWFERTDRHTWVQELRSDVIAQAKGFYFEQGIHAGLTSDNIGSFETGHIFGYGFHGRWGYKWADMVESLGTFRYNSAPNQPKFDTLQVGADLRYRPRFPGQQVTSGNGLMLSAEYAYRVSFGFGRQDHIVNLNLSFGY